MLKITRNGRSFIKIKSNNRIIVVVLKRIELRKKVKMPKHF
jgi:hypothetical protein